MCMSLWPQWFSHSIARPGHYTAYSPWTTILSGKKTRPRSSSCTACVSGSRRSNHNKKQHRLDPPHDKEHLPKFSSFCPPLPFLAGRPGGRDYRGKRIQALKNVSVNEPFFTGHLPARPVMPGVLIVKHWRRRQACCAFDMMGEALDSNTVFYFVRHRQRPFQAPRGVTGNHSFWTWSWTASRAASSSFKCCGARRWQRGLRGRHHVHHAHRGLNLPAGFAVSTIHPTALVDAAAQIDASVTIGPYAVIGPHVVLGAGTTISTPLRNEGHTTIGRDNRIFQFASLGAAPRQKIRWRADPADWQSQHHPRVLHLQHWHRPSQSVTRIGDDNWVMAYVHIAHDCVVGNQTDFGQQRYAGRPCAGR